MIPVVIILATIAVAYALGCLIPELGPEHINREGQSTAERTWGEFFDHHDHGDAR